MNKRLPIYKVELSDNDEMIVNSIVDEPAHRHYFIAQAQAKGNSLNFALNEEKKEITGVVIAANQPIYYYSNEIPECYLVFTPEIIKNIATSYFAKNKFNIIDLNHDFNIKDSDVTLIQTYFSINDTLFNVPDGSWIITYKVNNLELWDKVKQGVFKGFSIAGNFSLSKIELTKKPNIMNILEKIKKLIQQEVGNPKTEVKDIQGNTYYIEGEPTKGAKLWAVTADGSEILAPEGEYMLVVGELTVAVKVDEKGVIIEWQEQQAVQQSDNSNELAELQNKINDLQKLIEQKETDIKVLQSTIEQRFKETEEALITAVKELNVKLSNVKPVNVEDKKNINLKIK